MVTTLPIADTITNLAQAEEKFNLTASSDKHFFTEWSNDLPALTEDEQTRLAVIKQRFLYHRRFGQLAEGTVNFVVLSPLLEMAGFYDPPFLFRSEVSVQIAIEDQNEVLKGRIDALVIKEKLWVLLIESKQTAFSIDVAIPQALAYMMSSVNSDRPTFGLVSNGGYFMFLKLTTQPEKQYALSSDFSLYRQQNELETVLAVMRKIGQTIA